MLAEAAHDLGDEVERGALDRAQALDHILTQVRREHREDLGGFGAVEIGEHKGDRLRLLVFDQIENLPALHLADAFDDLDRGTRGAHATDNGGCLIVALGDFEGALGVVEPTDRGGAAIADDRGKFFQDLLADRVGDHRIGRHFPADDLDLGIVEILEDRGGSLGAHDDEEDRQFLGSRELAEIDVGHR